MSINGVRKGLLITEIALCGCSLVITGSMIIETMIHKFNKEKNLNAIDNRVATDTGVKSFATDHIVVDSYNKNTVEFVGSTVDSDGNINDNARVVYRFQIDDFNTFYDRVNTERYRTKKMNYRSNFSANFVDFIKKALENENCVFVGANFDIKTKDKDDTVRVTVTSPYISEESNLISYNIKVATSNPTEKTLKNSYYAVSTELTDELKNNPNSIFNVDKDKCLFTKVNEEKYDNVYQVIKKDDIEMIIEC